ncbi:hypothetical protein [Streptomyces brasiliscabiei]|uniref:hypothetical protein n=1 Tax=Streptomyces brasiliscabiei TaxID=2736302 RepID=UPI001C0F54AC|nr:hypothetical protein [Streptomyces brasiliscabiei]
MAATAGCGSDAGSDITQSSPQQTVPAYDRLVMPDSLADGRYRRDRDAADPDKTLAELMSGQVEQPTAAFGAYDPASDRSQALTLSVTGVYGTVLSPVTARDEFLRILDRRDNGPVPLVGPRAITPPGAQEPLQCRVTTRRMPDVDFDTVEAACTWADASTVAMVSEVLRPTVKPEDVNLDAFASEVDAIRNDVRASRG